VRAIAALGKNIGGISTSLSPAAAATRWRGYFDISPWRGALTFRDAA
jgi:hypothetical protein